jgi:hypothetical protein
MALTYGKLQEFVQRRGKVVALKPGDAVRILPNGEVDSIHLVENATMFLFDGRSYTKTEFENLVDSFK